MDNNLALSGLGRLFDFAEAGDVNRVTEKTIRKWTKRRTNPLPTVRISANTVRVSETHLVAWLQSQVRA